MATKLAPVDVAIVGFGWTGGILAKELAPTGLRIVALEEGGPITTNPDLLAPWIHDELRYAIRMGLMINVRRETLTFRNRSSQTALPMRRLGSFLPGVGVGGAGVHWNGTTWRWLGWDYQARTRTIEKYGKSMIPEDMQIQDWPVTYDELEPYYYKFEATAGVSGQAGNLDGKIIAGGNPFEEPRQKPYPNPPLTPSQSMLMFEKAAKDLGYHPFIEPAANSSRSYVNPDGVAFGPCHYCGFCERFGCEVNAKGSAHFTVIPIALRHPNVEMRTHCHVTKVMLDSTGKKATGVAYVDPLGHEVEQPADLVIMSAYALWNVHLLLLSKIGKPYDVSTGKGVVGRNYAYQCHSGATAFFDKDVITNPFMGAGSLGTWMDDFAGDNFDFAKAGFIGGGGVNIASYEGRPIHYHPVPSGTPRWGSAWKQAVVDHYNHTASVGQQGSVQSYRQNYLDLDPTYRDAYGRPLMRLTFDWGYNERNLMQGLQGVCVNIAKQMGAKRVEPSIVPIPYSIVPYQSTHNTGGAVFGTDPTTSVTNKYGQVWDVPNVFVTGACLFPQNSTKNPTGPVGALAFWTADAIKDRYLKNPGPLQPM